MPDETKSTDPQPVKPPINFAPSSSTVASAVGGALATITIAILGQMNIHFEAGVEAALAVLFSVVAGYIPPSGRQP